MQLQRTMFFASVAALIFVYGLVVGAYQVFPYQQLKFVLNSVEAVIADRDRLLGNRPSGYLAPRRHEGDGVTRYDAARAAPGLTLLSGFYGELPGLRLIDLDGGLVAQWPVAYTSLFENPDFIAPESDIPASNWHAAIHGMDILPDGSVVFNVDAKGMVKLDRCGRPLWTVERMTHHALDRAAQGGYWVLSRHWIEDEAAYPRFALPYFDDTLLRVSENGAVVSETSLNQVLVDNDLYALLVANGRFPSDLIEDDPLHTNDVEELTAEHAAAFPAFAVGDLLISMRHLNLVLVVDPTDWKVKWYQTGPWLRQHDPDFQADGTITVFDNHSDDTKRGGIHGGSRLLSIDPFAPTRPVRVLYGRGDGQAFFTNTQGKHQRLENGNFLVAEYYGGRAFEVTPGGDIVWEYISGYDEESVAKISGILRYPESYFAVDDWNCPQTAALKDDPP